MSKLEQSFFGNFRNVYDVEVKEFVNEIEKHILTDYQSIKKLNIILNLEEEPNVNLYLTKTTSTHQFVENNSVLSILVDFNYYPNSIPTLNEVLGRLIIEFKKSLLN